MLGQANLSLLMPVQRSQLSPSVCTAVAQTTHVSLPAVYSTLLPLLMLLLCMPATASLLETHLLGLIKLLSLISVCRNQPSPMPGSDHGSVLA
jgi:hypothetical protein